MPSSWTLINPEPCHPQSNFSLFPTLQLLRVQHHQAQPLQSPLLLTPPPPPTPQQNTLSSYYPISHPSSYHLHTKSASQPPQKQINNYTTVLIIFHYNSCTSMLLYNNINHKHTNPTYKHTYLSSWSLIYLLFLTLHSSIFFPYLRFLALYG